MLVPLENTFYIYLVHWGLQAPLGKSTSLDCLLTETLLSQKLLYILMYNMYIKSVSQKM